MLLAAAVYLVVAFPVGTWAGLRRQRGTNAWLLAGRRPTPVEAAHALRLPVDTALIAGSIWLVGAVLVGVVAAVSFPDARSGCASASRRCSAAWSPPASPTCSSPAPPAT